MYHRLACAWAHAGLRMVARVAVTVAVWLVGFLFLTSNGQHFTHAITLLVAAVLGALPWLSLVRRRHSVARRLVALAVLAASAVVVVLVSWHLPRAYEAQQEFNARSST